MLSSLSEVSTGFCYRAAQLSSWYLNKGCRVNTEKGIGALPIDWNMHSSLGAALLINSLVQHNWSGFKPLSFFLSCLRPLLSPDLSCCWLCCCWILYLDYWMSSRRGSEGRHWDDPPYLDSLVLCMWHKKVKLQQSGNINHLAPCIQTLNKTFTGVSHH